MIGRFFLYSSVLALTATSAFARDSAAAGEAAEAAADDGARGGEIVVTAQKREQKITD